MSTIKDSAFIPRQWGPRPRSELRSMVHPFHVSLDQPAFYRISVLGRLDKELASRLSDLELRYTQNEQGEELSVLGGFLGDQGALLGVLVQLYNRGFCLVGVERLNRAPEPQHSSPVSE